MAQRSTLEERCLLIIRIALEEEQRLASDPGYQGMAANGAQPAELGGAQCSVRMSELDRVRRRAWLRGLQEYMQDILDRARKGQCAPAQLPGLPHSGTHNAGRCSGSKMERGEEEDESPGEGAPTVEGLLELWDACKEKYLLFRSKGRATDGSISVFQHGKRIAAFSLYGVLLWVKSRNPGPQDADDWTLYNNNNPRIIEDLIANKYKIVIFSNQKDVGKKLEGAASKKHRQITENLITQAQTKTKMRQGMQLGADVTVVMATQDGEFRKPNPGMWNFFVEVLNGGITPVLSESFYVGNSDMDKEFAEKISLRYQTPKDVFGEGTKNSVAAGGPNEGMARYIASFAAEAEASGDVWRALSIRRAADTVAAFEAPIASGEHVKDIPGIGKKIMKWIDDYLEVEAAAGGGGGGEADVAAGSCQASASGVAGYAFTQADIARWVQ